MGRAKPKAIAKWMKNPWTYDIGTGGNCTMGCKCCKHTKLWKFCTTIKARFAKDFKMLNKAKFQTENLGARKTASEKFTGAR